MSDPYADDVVVALPFEGADAGTTFTDLASSPHTWVSTGGITTDTEQSHYYGSAAKFTGAGILKISPDNYSFLSNVTGDFTIEFWAYIPFASNTTGFRLTGQASTYDFSGNASGTGYGVFGNASTRQMSFKFDTDPSATTTYATLSLGIPSDNSWNHFAISRSSGILRCFLNGELTDSNTTSVGFGRNYLLVLGGDSGGESLFTGYIQDYRITLAGRYTLPFTPPDQIKPYASGTLVGLMPALSASVSASVLDFSAMMLPHLTGAMAINVSPTGRLIGSLPVLSGSIALYATDTLDGTLPSLTGTFYEQGVIAARLPSLRGAITLVYVPLPQTVSVTDGFFLNAAPTAQPIYALRDALALQTTPTIQVILQALLTEQLTQADAIQYVALAMAADGMTLTSTASTATVATLVAAELLSLIGQTSNTLTIAGQLTEYLAAADAIQYVAAMSATETLGLADTLTAAIRARFTATETLALADVISTSLVILAAETMTFDETVTPNLIVQLLAQERLAFIGKLPLEEGDFSAWVLNADTTGTTSYANFPFNSLFTHNGETLGVTETGLYRLEGDTDDGEDIAATIKTGDIDFGTGAGKNIPHAYLYILTSGELILKTVASRFGTRTEVLYEIKPRAIDNSDDDSLRRVQLRRSLRGTWWSFELTNVDGADFNFQNAEILPVVLSRRG